MSLAHTRRKQPEDVRRRLLSAAADTLVDSGMAALTLDTVARRAGVSKGGLLHHFPDKKALLDGLFDRLITRFDAEIEERMRADPVARGRFTRAYLQAVAGLDQHPDDQAGWLGLTVALFAEPQMRRRWCAWVEERADAHVGTDSHADAVLARLATDGLWLADRLGSHAFDAGARAALFQRLMALSHGS